MNQFLKRSLKLKALAAAVTVSLLLSAISIFYWARVEHDQQIQLQKVLQSEAHKVTELFANQFNTFDLVARSVKGFIEGSEDVTYEEFQTFITSLDLKKMAPGIQGVGLSWLFIKLDFQEKLARITSRTLPDYNSDAWSKYYAPIIYMEPDHFNVNKVGHNILANSKNRTAAYRSDRVDQLSASQRIASPHDAKNKKNFHYNLFLPIYASAEYSNNSSQAENNLLGWIVLTFSLEESLKPIIHNLSDELELRYQEIAENEKDNLLIAYMNGVKADNPSSLAESIHSIKQTVNHAGKDWYFEINPSQNFVNQYLKKTHTWIAIAGTLLGASLGFIIYLMMTARYRAERLAFEMTAKMRKVADDMSDTLNAIPDLLFEMDMDARYLKINTSNESVLNYSAEVLIGKTIWEVLPTEAATSVKKAIDEASQSGRSTGTRIEIPVHGKQKWFELSISKKTQSHQGNEKFIVLSRDITERAEAEIKIHQLAFFDVLTGLPNRSQFLIKANEILQRKFAKSQAAVLMLDIDNFKNINDQWGHKVGDSLLKIIGARVQSAVGHRELVARFGGDEFMVFVSDLSDNTTVATQIMTATCKTIAAELAQPISIEGREFFVSSSIGVVLTGDDSKTLDELISYADFAMYQAKASGKNTFSFYDHFLKNEMLERSTLEQDMRKGLSLGHFELVYQPQINQSGQVIAAEALCRWKHPKKGYISPQRFIELAENNGFIFDLGNWVIQKSCERLAIWKKHPNMQHIRIAVNVSAKQFHHPDFEQNLLYQISMSGIDPKLLELELTESALLNDVESVVTKMKKIKSLGINFSLDDFGTGYSSLSYLKRLPLDHLKIDQSFVRDIIEDNNDAVIIQTIIALGESLGLNVIAEGVENAEQHQYLMQHRCFIYQGYLFSRPISALDFESYVGQRSN